MALALCLTLLPTAALATEAEGAEHKHPICGTTCPGHIVDGKNDTHESVEWTAINDAAGLERAQADGYYYLTKDVELSGSWNPPNNITLDLNGKTITVEAESDKIITAINVIDVAFTLTDCKGTGKITHKQGGGKGGGVYVSGGVYASIGTFNMNGETSIKSNIGNGVFVNGGTFTVAGAPTVTENTMNEDASNVFLAGSKTITIGGKLNEGASIGVDTNLVPAEGKPIVVAEGSKKSGSSYTVQESDAKAFFSDHRTYQHIELLDGSVKLCYGAAHTPTPEHNHIWAYTLSSDHKTITATCTNTMGNCDVNKDGGSVTITAPEHKTYGDDKSAEAQLTKANWRGNDDNVEKITYSTQGGTLLNAAPTEVGKYKASITVGGKTAFVEYEGTSE